MKNTGVALYQNKRGEIFAYASYDKNGKSHKKIVPSQKKGRLITVLPP